MVPNTDTRTRTRTRKNHLSDNYWEFPTHPSPLNRCLPGHVTSWSPNILDGLHVTWMTSWKNLEKWRHRRREVSKAVLSIFYFYFLVRVIVYVTRKAELFDRGQFFHRRVKFFCQFGTSRKTDVAPTFSPEKVKNLVVKGISSLWTRFLCRSPNIWHTRFAFLRKIAVAKDLDVWVVKVVLSAGPCIIVTMNCKEMTNSLHVRYLRLF